MKRNNELLKNFICQVKLNHQDSLSMIAKDWAQILAKNNKRCQNIKFWF